MISTAIATKPAIDAALSLAGLVKGPNDPSACFDARGAFWRATWTPEGPSTVRVSQRASGEIHVTAWGDGAEHAIAHAPELVGAKDALDGFSPRGKLAELHRRFAGLRMVRTRAVFETAVYAILEQLVSGLEAYRSYCRMVRAWSEPAPGPKNGPALMLPPSAAALKARTSYDFRAMDVGMRRAQAIAFAARRAERLEEAIDMAPDAAAKRIAAFRGIGPWTCARVLSVALGDADAVPIGDFNLPHLVVYAFTGAPRGSDAQMLELLAPYAGHRGRVIRLLHAAGISAPRFGPRHRLR